MSMNGLLGDDGDKGEGKESREEKEDYESVLTAIAMGKYNSVLQWTSGLSYPRVPQFSSIWFGAASGV